MPSAGVLPGAALLRASAPGGRGGGGGSVSATFTVPLDSLPPPGPDGGTAVVWSVGQQVVGFLAQHGPTHGVHYGAASLGLLCATDGGPCVVATGSREETGFTSLHKIALTGARGRCRRSHRWDAHPQLTLVGSLAPPHPPFPPASRLLRHARRGAAAALRAACEPGC